MPAINVAKSISIKSPVDKVFTTLNNFNYWPKWSPWMILEPGVNVTVSDDAKYYEWVGDKIGSGNMKITGEEKNHRVNYDLTFLTPWKSHAKVAFTVSKEGDETYVTWTMDSSLPWFMFWMKAQMEGFIGMDFERGLKLLKDYLENGDPGSNLDFVGSSNFNGATFVGLKNTCKMDKIGEVMTHDFDKMGAFAKEQGENCTDFVFAQYHKWDMKNMSTTYTVGFGVKNLPANIPDGFYSGEIPATPIYTVRHTGPYHHLGNAWSALMVYGRSKVFKQNKRIDPFEVYVSDPSTTDAKELITDVCFPVK